MKNYVIIFSLLLSINNNLFAIRDYQKADINDYMTEIVAGGLIGAGVGALSAVVDKKMLPLLPITWAAAMFLRNGVVKDLSRNLRTTGSAMSAVSCLTSWVVYFMMLEAMAPRNHHFDFGLFDGYRFRN